eukprot:scaffold131859_cov75-Phaeocystis_antarctica.AAC.4
MRKSSSARSSKFSSPPASTSGGTAWFSTQTSRSAGSRSPQPTALSSRASSRCAPAPPQWSCMGWYSTGRFWSRQVLIARSRSQAAASARARARGAGSRPARSCGRCWSRVDP